LPPRCLSLTTSSGWPLTQGAIERWLQRTPTSPITGTAMPEGPLLLNYALRDAIDEWRAEQPLALDPAHLTIDTSDVLGEGSFGVVVGGTLSAYGRAVPVAVKTLPAMTRRETREQFDRELKAHLTAQRGADGVCQLLGTCTKNSKLCLVMRRYAGSLADKIANGEADGLPEGEVRRIAGSLCHTVEQLHAAGVIVKDIKPDNVLLDAYDRPVLADFGISAVVTRTVQVMPRAIEGTFNYLAPEAFETHGYGCEVDVWAMGCLVVEMVSRVPPWDTLQMHQIMRAVCDHRQTPTVPDGTPERDLVQRCFSFDPAGRPTAGELAVAFNSNRHHTESQATRVEQLTTELENAHADAVREAAVHAQRVAELAAENDELRIQLARARAEATAHVRGAAETAEENEELKIELERARADAAGHARRATESVPEKADTDTDQERLAMTAAAVELLSILRKFDVSSELIRAGTYKVGYVRLQLVAC
jgi:tRNA A-37 threonylcarbamoyl transferase component Bud32